MVPIAAENLPSSLYTPVVVLLAAYVVLKLLAGRARAAENVERTDRWETYAFAVLLVAALYVIVLVISAVFAYPSRSTDMVTIIIVVSVFFALLLFVFFGLAEWIPGQLRRGRSER